MVPFNIIILTTTSQVHQLTAAKDAVKAPLFFFSVASSKKDADVCRCIIQK